MVILDVGIRGLVRRVMSGFKLVRGVSAMVRGGFF